MVNTITELFEEQAKLLSHGRILDSAESAAGQMQRKIIQAATKHFVQFGYRRASIADIASSVGIGKGTIYLHFKSKKEIFLCCQLAEEQQLLPKFENIEKMQKKERFSAYVEASLNFATSAPLSRALLARPHDFAFMLGEIGPDRIKNFTSKGNEYVAKNLINPIAQNLNTEAQIDIAKVINIVIHAIGHLPDSVLEISNIKTGDFIEIFTKILEQGTKNTRSIKSERK